MHPPIEVAGALDGCLQLWALDPDTGAIRWTNGLPGLGYGHAIIASANQVPVTVAATQVSAAMTAAAGSTTS